MREVDELNAVIGVLREKLKGAEDFQYINQIQHQLFKLGALFAAETPEAKVVYQQDLDRWTEELERQIDQMDESCEPLRQFIVPAGSEAIAFAHVCRAVARRAERRYNQLVFQEQETGHASRYLNRLSDFFFILARYIAVYQKVVEVPWNKEV